MKSFFSTVLLMFIIGIIGALDTESSQFINHLVNLKTAGPPEVFDDGILWTAPASYKKVGIAFAHEGFSKVYWFQKLMVPDDSPKPQLEETKEGPPVTYKDSGILFYTYTVPRGIESVEYRLIINGLWTTDPSNPNKRQGEAGLSVSVAPLPPPPAVPSAQESAATGYVHFSYQGKPGLPVFVAGSFNNWDPFMYELKEKTPGYYSLVLYLPKGTYQYVFFIRGDRVLDYNNLNRVYRDGLPVNQLDVSG
jgi:hypothetical protein